ncbi:MAG: transporter [Gemmatimonadales bacterium]|nr:MAG: transporter [Gemmatimonadales bacterium]
MFDTITEPTGSILNRPRTPAIESSAHDQTRRRSRLRTLSLVLILLLGASFPAEAQERWSSSGPSGHAPIGVMGDHTHHQGEWMLSYMFARESMSGLRNGRSAVSIEDAWMQYRMVPLTMQMDMHMPHLMYAPSNRVTLMVMAMWMDHSMDVRMDDDLMAGHGHGHGHGHGMSDPHRGDGDGHGHQGQFGFHTMGHSISGWADTEVSALVTVMDRDRQRVHLNLGVGIPTGSVTDGDHRMVPEHSRLGYPMQLGSGSWEARPGVTYLLQTDRVSWGAQGLGSLRLNENSEGWKRGGEGQLNAWGMLRGSDLVSPGLRLQARRWGNVRGADPALDPAISPENDPALQGGTRVNGFLAVNLQVPSGPFAGHRVALEWGGPLLESLNGPQISADWTFNLGWEYSF